MKQVVHDTKFHTGDLRRDRLKAGTESGRCGQSCPVMRLTRKMLPKPQRIPKTQRTLIAVSLPSHSMIQLAKSCNEQ